MPIMLDHTIVPARNKDAAARLFAQLFGLAYDGPSGHFAPVRVNETLTLDFDEFGEEASIESHHYAFHVDEATFDAVLGRVKAAGLRFGSHPWSPENGDRSNHPFGWVEGEARQYGACNFEVGGSPKRAEPPPSVRGDAARVWFYMAETYTVPLTPAQRALLSRWSLDDPVDEWELLRDERIEAAQGNRNPFVRP